MTFAVALLLNALAAGPLTIPAPPPLDTTCLYPPDRHNFTEFSTPVFRQGATVGIRPMRDQMPAGYRRLPDECVSGWSLEGPATLSADRQSLTIRPDAAPGAEITLRYSVRGEPVVSRLRVVARDAVVLTGTWSQSAAEGCEGLEPVRELEFGPERFSVTFTPFETYRDYWGVYSFDPVTRALRLRVEGGGNVPTGLDLEGSAAIVDGHLVLEGMFLGNTNGPPTAGGCRYRF